MHALTDARTKKPTIYIHTGTLTHVVNCRFHFHKKLLCVVSSLFCNASTADKSSWICQITRLSSMLWWS